jgi:excisionase family DNA binding protein
MQTISKLSYTVDEAAKGIGVSRSKIYKLVREGELTTFKWCGRTLIRADVLQAALDRASGAAPSLGMVEQRR